MRKVHPAAQAAFVLPAVLWFCLIVIFPVFMSIYYSAFDWDGVTAKVFVGIGNYVEMFSDSIVRRSVSHSVVLALFSVIFQLPLGMFFALLLYNRRVKGRGFFRTLFFLPVILSSSMIGILWGQIYDPNFGLINSALAKLGMASPYPTWLADPKLALGCVIAVVIWQYIGNYMLIFYMALHNVSEDVMEYASIDGAKPLTLFFNIQLPLVWPTIRLTIILATINSLKYFDLIYIMTNGGPNYSSEVLATYVMRSAFSSMRYGYANAVSVLLLLLGILFLLLYNRLLKADQDY